MSDFISPSSAPDKPDAAPRRSALTKRDRKRTRRVLIIVLTVLAVLLASGVGVVWYYAKTATDALSKVHRDASLLPPDDADRPAPPPVVDGKQAPMNVLIMGSDTRGGTDPGRSDVLMLAHVPADRKNVYLVSFPRDMWVPIPGHGEAKINAAYAYGQAPLTVRTIENLTGVRIDHVTTTDFEGFMSVIDAIGGIEVTNANASKSAGIEFPKGKLQLDGKSALTYARERKDLPNGDLDRAKRQRDVVIAVVRKIATPEVLANPGKFKNVINTMAPYFSVDSSFTNEAMTNLALSMRITSTSAIRSLQAPLSGFGRSDDGQSIDVVDDQLMKDLSDALKSDNMAPYWEAHRNDPPIP